MNHVLLENNEVGIQAMSQRKTCYVQIARFSLRIVVHNKKDAPEATNKLISLADFLCTDYGAARISLFIGDVVLEWGDDSLVIPKSEAIEEEPMNTDVTPLLPAVGEVRQTIELSSRETPIFEELAKVISKYNTKFYYHGVKRNCQTFVKDALKALDVAEAMPVASDISKRIQQLKEKKLGDIPDSFAQHEDLDDYIMTKGQRWLEHLDPDSLDFLKFSYMQFHGDAPCHVLSCRQSMLLEALQQIHRFH